MVDLGAGSCAFASLLHSKAALQQPVMCVDPSQAMLEQAASLAGVSTLCQAAEEWAAGGQEADSTTVFIKAAVHHLNRATLEQTMAGIRRRLGASGRLVVEKTSADTWSCLPYPHQLIRLNQERDLPTLQLREAMLRAGFSMVQVHVQRFPVKISKAEMFEGFRQRETSGFMLFSDEQIEEGIVEVDSRFTGDTLEFTMIRDIVIGLR